MKVRITDVFLRDGLQDEEVIVSTADKLAVAEALVAAGVDRIEAGSFVNPKKVPQMADAAAVFTWLPAAPGVDYTVLALNGKGVARAAEAGVKNVQVVTSASQAHSSANAGQGIESALASLGEEVARHPEMNFFAGISTAFTCPFEGDIDPAHLLRVVRAFKAMGITTVGLADTLGTTPTDRLMASLGYVREHEPELEYYLHLHNAHGQALATVSAAVDAGITNFDSALGGYGGCPFAPGAHGNIDTQELVRHLHASGYETGIDEQLLAEAVRLAREVVAKSPALEQKPAATR
ncbi:hydroxymethylglutaryl-CoA lyase [Arthrobacter crystallopoietes]|uniref:Hydroxymethylglutaryl-CoA lyase n=1 Tax=Crystallibacter crystallopoietes TaxID=37928 RepID=A0A1H1A996_9MICC|nr:hydroxymethylglutaryl-CoA lyase [Arthrobacter crystallopoietes]AUI51627.1 hydroxymethylglutaryl-CoA lyase [Arthrobacter crystallopoietes]SDQ36071.1 hydroxymethylglutaryl-CoA lyase [Arthrobacter crystallopoietes]